MFIGSLVALAADTAFFVPSTLAVAWIVLQGTRRAPAWIRKLGIVGFIAGSIVGWFTVGKVLVREWVFVVEPGDMQYADYLLARRSSLVAGALFMGLAVSALVCLATAAASGSGQLPDGA